MFYDVIVMFYDIIVMFYDVTNVTCCQIDVTEAKWAVRHETVYDIIERNDYDVFLIWYGS
jgi:hypothetical protein